MNLNILTKTIKSRLNRLDAPTFDKTYENIPKYLDDGLLYMDNLLHDIESIKQIALEYSPWGKYGHDPVEQYKWTLKAAELGDSDSMVRIGSEYIIGEVVPRDRTLAFGWYQKAANCDNARGYLGMAEEYGYQSGCQGISDAECISLEQLEHECLLKALECCTDDDDACMIYSSLGWLYGRPNAFCFNPFYAIDAFDLSEKYGNTCAREKKLELMKKYSISPQDLANWQEQFETQQEE